MKTTAKERKAPLTEEAPMLVSHARLHLGDSEVDVEQTAGVEVRTASRKGRSGCALRGVVSAFLELLDQVWPEGGFDRDLER